MGCLYRRKSMLACVVMFMPVLIQRIQSNAIMKPYRNSGWAHYEKVQAILPNARARGCHAFSAKSSTMPSWGNEGIEETGTDMDNVSSSGGGGGGPMNVDNPAFSVSNQNGKRKVSALSIDDPASENGSSGLSHFPPSIDDPASESSFSHFPPSDSVSSLSGRKKTRLLASSHMSSSAHKTSFQEGNVTDSLAMQGVQWSLDRLNDTLTTLQKIHNVAPACHEMDSTARASALLKQRDNVLSRSDRADMLTIFSVNVGAVGIYLDFEDEDVDLRRSWLKSMLDHFRFRQRLFNPKE